MSAGERVYPFPDGQLAIMDQPDGRRRVGIRLTSAAAFCPVAECATAYSDDLILACARTKGLVWTCDEILRDEDPERVARALRITILRYIEDAALAGKRLLDFGSGSGASTFNMARMFPQTECVGLELDPRLVALAEARREFYREARISFRQVEQGDALPADLGEFDFIMLNAVYEHLLPEERRRLLPSFWKILKPGGILFISETPYRWSVMEWHTTGLPLTNYLTDRQAHLYACSFSRRVKLWESWHNLLKGGIRGCDPAEVVAILKEADPGVSLMTPTRLGYWRAIDDWPVKDEEVWNDFKPWGLRLRKFREHIRLRVKERAEDPQPTWPQPMAAFASLAVLKSNGAA